MKYTDPQIQAFIDVAFLAGNPSRYSNLDTFVNQYSWLEEAPNRLSIAKAFLEKLELDPYADERPEVSNPVQDMALGGQMRWRDLALQLAEVWWKCHSIGASLQHGDIDNDVSFTVCCELHGGRCFHADTPSNAWRKAEKWLMSPDRENFPALDAVKEVAQ